MHPEATRNHYYQPLIASYHYLAIITSFKSLFLNFGNFEPVYHWSRCVLSVLSVVEAVVKASNPCLFAVELLLVIIDTKAWRLNWFSGGLSRSYTEVAVCYQWWKQWQNVQSRSICTGRTTSDSRYQGLAVEFQDYWACLALKLLCGRREAASFISALSADTHLLSKAEGSLWIKS